MVKTLHLTLYIGLLLALIAAGALSLLAKGSKSRHGALSRPWPLEAKRYLLSERERALYQHMVESLPDHIVLAQVQLLQALKFKRRRRPYAALNRISQLSLDFLILNANTSLVAAIELDDVTHELGDRWQADAIWWSFPLASICSIAMASGYYRFGGWRKVRLGVLAEQPAPAASV